MIGLRTGSRLHFGLFRPGPVAQGQRRFGGVGLMLEDPGFLIRAFPSPSWAAEGPFSERVLYFANHVCEKLNEEVSPLRFVVEEAPPDHAGLGTGTQLGLSVARLITTAAGNADLRREDLAILAGRGRRSALGIYGFGLGGLLVESGKLEREALSPLVARMELPANWRVLLLLPPGERNWHGRREEAVFDSMPNQDFSDALRQLVLLELLPAAASADLDGFGEALYAFNRKAGEPFASAQGDLYAGLATAEAVQSLRALGVKGVGQSSWGPLVFAVAADAEQAAYLVREVARRCSFSPAFLRVVAPSRHGAVLL